MMNYDTNSGLSASDVALLTGNNRNNDGFGGDNAWWVIILLLALGGWGRGFGGGFGGGNDGGTTFVPYNAGGFGGFGGSNCGIDPWGTIQRQLDQGFTNLNTDINQVNNNVTNGFYNTNTNLLNGFANTNLATANGFATTQRQLCDATSSINANINNNGYETRLLGVNMNSALQQCCCDLKTNVADLKYTVATENCADRQALSDGIRDVIASNTANTQAILDKLCQQEIDAKNETIANLRTQLNMADLRASQTAQNQFIAQQFTDGTDSLYNRLKNCPVNAVPVYGNQPIFSCNPSWNNNNCGCGCGNNF